MAGLDSIGRAVSVPAQVIPEVGEVELSSRDIRTMLAQIGRAYPETEKAMDAAERMIVHLETLRHEALLPLALKHYDNVETLLKQPAMVGVQPGENHA
ncbi:MAG: hypothetical protein KGL40_07075 [Rhodocyclaceae bacterium]|nr:hypothetical protein [Rhodocyclaceae bacterium]